MLISPYSIYTYIRVRVKESRFCPAATSLLELRGKADELDGRLDWISSTRIFLDIPDSASELVIRTS